MLKKPKILVVGSFMMDLITSAPRVPNMGETVTGFEFRTAPGGKGSNQAIQCARLGADVTMLGCVGDDAFGKELLASSAAAGVDVSIGELRETYTKTMSKSKVTGTSWKRKVAELVGKVNSGSFKGWNAGEVMFLGCSYSAPSKGSKKVSVSFHFAIRLNESKATVAGQNVGSVKGFEYLWALTDDEVKDGERKRRVRKIYKAVVCGTDSFGGLGI